MRTGFPFNDQEFDPTTQIGLFAGLSLTDSHSLSQSQGDETLCLDTPLDEIIPHSIGSALGQALVIGLRLEP
jgi:hypothetical protein